MTKKKIPTVDQTVGNQKLCNHDDSTTNHVVNQVPTLALRPQEAARALGIGTRKLWEMTNSGEIPCVRFGRSVRYSLEALRCVLIERSEGGRR